MVVTDTPDAGLTLVRLVPGDLPMSCGGDTCTIDLIPAGQSVEIYALVEALATTLPGFYSNEACAIDTANTFDNTPQCATAPIDVVTGADLVDRQGGTGYGYGGWAHHLLADGPQQRPVGGAERGGERLSAG